LPQGCLLAITSVLFLILNSFLAGLPLLPYPYIIENKDSPKNLWKGPFYYYPKDTRLTVPRPMGNLWTLNFGHWRVVAIIGAIILLLAILAGLKTSS